MLKSLSGFRLAAAMAGLMLVTALFAIVCNAAGSDITYYIVDYPFNEGVVSGTGADSISGTIITDGTIGPITETNIVGGTLAFKDSDGGLTAGDATFGSPISLQATSTELLLDSGQSFSISATQTGPPTLYPSTAIVGYKNDPSDGQYYGEISIDTGTAHYVLSLFDSAPVSSDPRSIGANSDWVIAAVPEPPSPALLLAATVCFLIVASTRSSRKEL